VYTCEYGVKCVVASCGVADCSGCGGVAGCGAYDCG
jgi:hypothetical protein